jgi:EF hand
MLRYLAGVASALLLVAAGVFLFRSDAATEAPAAPAPRAALATVPQEAESQAEEPALPQSSPKSREERRFGRYDKDKNGLVGRDEYLLSRRKAYAKLDTNGDGRLTFDEWAVKTTGKFASADKDRSGGLSAAEFATTAVKRTARRRAPCPPTQSAD